MNNDLTWLLHVILVIQRIIRAIRFYQIDASCIGVRRVNILVMQIGNQIMDAGPAGLPVIAPVRRLWIKDYGGFKIT